MTAFWWPLYSLTTSPVSIFHILTKLSDEAVKTNEESMVNAEIDQINQRQITMCMRQLYLHPTPIVVSPSKQNDNSYDITDDN